MSSETEGFYEKMWKDFVSLQRGDVQQLCKDAERYRWLREQHWHNSSVAIVCKPKENVKLGSTCLSHELLDSMIDSEIAKEKSN